MYWNVIVAFAAEQTCSFYTTNHNQSVMLIISKKYLLSYHATEARQIGL